MTGAGVADAGANDEWSPLAAEWAARWGGFAAPVREAVLAATAVGAGAGARLLDAGCGSGELLRLAADRGAAVAGCDPAAAMLAIAREAVPEADLRVAGVEALPWPDAAFDVVTAVNALHLADDEAASLEEVRRVLVPGGRFALASWAERGLNEIDALKAAVAAADAARDDDGDGDGDADAERDGAPAPHPGAGPGADGIGDAAGGPPGGPASVLAGAGFTVVASGLVAAPWTAPDADALVAGVLLGEDAAAVTELRPALLRAAAPFRTADGGYRLLNHLRWAVGRV